MSIYKYELSTGTWMIDDEEIVLYSSNIYTGEEMKRLYREAVISILNSNERKYCVLDDVKHYLCKKYDFFEIDLSSTSYLRELSKEWIEEVELKEELKKKKTDFVFLTTEELTNRYQIKTIEFSGNLLIDADNSIIYDNIQCFPTSEEGLLSGLLDRLKADYHIKKAYIGANVFDLEGNKLQIDIYSPSQSCKGNIVGILLDVYIDE